MAGRFCHFNVTWNCRFQQRIAKEITQLLIDFARQTGTFIVHGTQNTRNGESRIDAFLDLLKRHESTRLPAELDYRQVDGLSNEIRQKLIETRPQTLGQAARISGVTPAAVSILLIHLKKRRLIESSEVAAG